MKLSFGNMSCTLIGVSAPEDEKSKQESMTSIEKSEAEIKREREEKWKIVEDCHKSYFNNLAKPRIEAPEFMHMMIDMLAYKGKNTRFFEIPFENALWAMKNILQEPCKILMKEMNFRHVKAQKRYICDETESGYSSLTSSKIISWFDEGRGVIEYVNETKYSSTDQKAFEEYCIEIQKVLKQRYKIKLSSQDLENIANNFVSIYRKEEEKYKKAMEKW